MWSRLLLLAVLLPTQAFADVKEKVAALAPSALVLVMDADGKELVAQNADEPFVPASVTKIVTTWLALQVLGADYRFETRFYLDGRRVLTVHGGGDPFLISEELTLLATELVAAVGKKPIAGMVLDGSYFPADLRIPGVEDTNKSFDTLNSALAVNFNTIQAQRKGKTVKAHRKYRAGERQKECAGDGAGRDRQAAYQAAPMRTDTRSRERKQGGNADAERPVAAVDPGGSGPGSAEEDEHPDGEQDRNSQA